MENNNVGYIALSVDNFIEVKQWYEEEVNLFTVSEGHDSVVLAGPNGFALELRKGKPLDHPERVVVGIHSDKIDVLFTRLNEVGDVELLVNPEKTEHGRRVLYTNDPAGHTVEFFEVIEEEATQDLSLGKAEQ
jgi:catechol-2,3-dioxygenase